MIDLARELVDTLLIRDPIQRATVYLALKSDWIRSEIGDLEALYRLRILDFWISSCNVKTIVSILSSKTWDSTRQHFKKFAWTTHAKRQLNICINEIAGRTVDVVSSERRDLEFIN